MKGRLFFFIGIFLSITLVSACSQSSNKSTTSEPYQVNLNPADFVEIVDNAYFPLLPGTRWVYEGQTEDGLERIEIEVLKETREVIGIKATILRDIVYQDGVLIEDTFDWYAQDKDGNVWYLGEEVSNFKDGKYLNNAGSWEAGVDEALPGIIMYANPASHLGETYRQEYYKTKAEDVADLLSSDETVTIPYGTFEQVVKTKDYTPLEPDVEEHKFYAPGIGLIKEVDVNSGEEILLVEFLPPTK